MVSVLLQEDPFQTTLEEEGPSFQVEVVVLTDGTFVDFATNDYQVMPDSILLVGSGGPPREFVVNFQLSPESVQAGYTWADPALKFFQGGSKKAGFRVSPNPDKITATVTLFNTKSSTDPSTSDEFSMLRVHPDGRIIPHDPTIIWDPPGGGA